MAVREILLLGNPTLRAKCEKVRSFSDGTVKALIQDLTDTLVDFRTRNGFGRGIASPQIGVTKRIIFVDVDRPIALINPEIVNRSRATMLLWDDCFSFPDILVKVRRNVKVVVRFHDAQGTINDLPAEGGLSELLQHEIDHINGMLAIDRAIDSKHIVMRSEWKKSVNASKNTHTL
ncbi:MAG: peptide deformylase [Ignavibacteriae bacterium]|nr:peptide deformylase [Ignavibacteria bacterium]MBI3365204.1 peptide deformylase [Ignavibacteriota bacterium]